MQEDFRYSRMEFSEEQQEVIDKAIKHAKTIKRKFARELADTDAYKPDEDPVSVFMSGSPGAGKTEVSKQLIARYESDGNGKVLRIDPDELRVQFEDYNGKNSFLFQGAVSLLVEKIHDLALKQKQSFILDGTLSKYEVAKRNIRRSLDKGRFVQILYVYQEPMQAWRFVQAREATEGRNITPDSFVEQYFTAREVVNRLKRELGGEVRVDLLVKNVDGSDRLYKAGVDVIDNHIPEKYTRDQIRAMIANTP